jgi:hypothetical protein
VLGASLVSADERKVDVGLGSGRELDFGLFCGFADTLNSHAVLGKINAWVLLLEFAQDVFDQHDIEVCPSQ